MRSILNKSFLPILITITFLSSITSQCQENQEGKTGNVIFFHPDGTALAGWNAIRVL